MIREKYFWEQIKNEKKQTNSGKEAQSLYKID